MSDQTMYHEGMRNLQISAKRGHWLIPEQVTVRSAFTAEDRAFIESRPMLFVATADSQGHPDAPTKAACLGLCECSMIEP